ncbi:MAG: hypothetical protein HQM10_05250 [Candidatus Riflebacteria bacterium]|nr:hypothetical protein [Candidatus Riflebacteria bacterium]
MKKNINIIKMILILLAAFVCQTQILSAIPYNAGIYVVDLDIYNKNMLLIPSAYAKCSLKDDVIKVKVLAPGYETKKFEIAAGGGQTYFKRDVVLEDIRKQIVVYSFIGEPIKSAYYDDRQFGYSPNDYGLSVYVPKKAWPKPSDTGIKIIEDVWGSQINYTCKISSEMSDFHEAKLTIPRGYLMTSGKRLLVMIDTSGSIPDNEDEPELDDTEIARSVQMIKIAENELMNSKDFSSEIFSENLFNKIGYKRLLQYSQNGGDLTDHLRKKVKDAERFNSLHNE